MSNQSLSDILWEQAIASNNFANAEKIYLHLCQTNNAQAEHHTVMGLWYQQMHEYTKAIQAFQAALALDSDSVDELYYQTALCYFEKENYSKAFNYLTLSLNIDPDFADAIFLKAETAALLDDKETAAALYKRLLGLINDDVQLCITVAASLSEIGYVDEALEIYHRALLIEPDNYYLYSNLGAEYTGLGEYEDALFCHEKALAINQFCSDLWYNLACTYAQCDRPLEALNALSKAISLDNANKEYAANDDELLPLHSLGQFWKLIE